ncbi:hypothetical protein, partial [Yersinia canariae]|uniref:hypothetical protein n=1 Tax=Yersinia canariae TaxID=2607663 RepID=UPI001C6FCF43
VIVFCVGVCFGVVVVFLFGLVVVVVFFLVCFFRLVWGLCGGCCCGGFWSGACVVFLCEFYLLAGLCFEILPLSGSFISVSFFNSIYINVLKLAWRLLT